MQTDLINECFHNVRIGAIITFKDTDGEILKGTVTARNMSRICIETVKYKMIDFRTLFSDQIDSNIIQITQIR